MSSTAKPQKDKTRKFYMIFYLKNVNATRQDDDSCLSIRCVFPSPHAAGDGRVYGASSP